MPELKAIIANHPEGFFNQLQSICLEAGVKVVYTPCINKAPISGSTCWLNGDTPFIQLTGRYNRNDSFWFTFFHEAGHILLHGKRIFSWRIWTTRTMKWRKNRKWKILRVQIQAGCVIQTVSIYDFLIDSLLYSFFLIAFISFEISSIVSMNSSNLLLLFRYTSLATFPIS